MKFEEISIHTPELLCPAGDAFAKLRSDPLHFFQHHAQRSKFLPLLRSDGMSRDGRGGQNQDHVHVVRLSPFLKQMNHVGLLQKMQML